MYWYIIHYYGCSLAHTLSDLIGSVLFFMCWRYVPGSTPGLDTIDLWHAFALFKFCLLDTAL